MAHQTENLCAQIGDIFDLLSGCDLMRDRWILYVEKVSSLMKANGTFERADRSRIAQCTPLLSFQRTASSNDIELQGQCLVGTYEG